MRKLLLALLFAAFAGPQSWALHEPTQSVTGQVVAYSGGLACLNGNGYWSIIFFVVSPGSLKDQFLQIEFSEPCAASLPDWVAGQSLPRMLHLIRQSGCDGELEEFMRDDTKGSPPIPNWRTPQGANPVPLPFGKVLPCFHAVELPFRPVL